MATHKSGQIYWIDEAARDVVSDITLDAFQGAVVLPENSFIQLLRLERRRTERSGRPFMLALIKCENFHLKSDNVLLDSIIGAIAETTRETDLLGWYEYGSTLGLLMTELGVINASTSDIISQKVKLAVQRKVTIEDFRHLSFQFRLFPEEVLKSSDDDDDVPILYRDIFKSFSDSKRRRGQALKRVVDVLGSIFALLVLFPLFLVIAILVKLTSQGPVLFCQKRVGRYGKEFYFYKFRTMYTGNDPQIHQDYVSKLIAGNVAQNGVYKIVNDPRVTKLGRFLRKSSLDELPQFFNVLKNDMSLVGPRPPLPYEFERYQVWHKRRVLELKPGLTGLWQVAGRSRTTFDEMVRMDLKYSSSWTVWGDIKILSQTPRAVLTGVGAY